MTTATKQGELIKQEQVAGRLASQSNSGTQYGSNNNVTPITTLKDLGITKIESSRAQEVDEYKELIPSQPSVGKFSIARELAQIKAGTHFWCNGHLQAIPLAEQSPEKPNYCRSCLAMMTADKKVGRLEVGRWSNNDSLYRLDGKNYGVSKTGATILVKEDSAKPLEADVSLNNIGQKDVTKLAGGNILPPQSKAALKTGVVMQHPGGRPVKTGKVTRMTEWRRRKARK